MPYSPIPTLNTFNMPNTFGLVPTDNNNAQECDDDRTMQCLNVSSSPHDQHSPTTTVVTIPINHIRPTAIIIPTQHKALQALCTQNNIHFKRVVTENLVRQVHYAILDSGATGHFLVEGAPLVNEKKVISPVTITLASVGTL